MRKSFHRARISARSFGRLSDTWNTAHRHVDFGNLRAVDHVVECGESSFTGDNDTARESVVGQARTFSVETIRVDKSLLLYNSN